VLYMEKRLPPNLSEFSTLLLIQAVYRKSREAINQNATQLSSWTPSAKVQPWTRSIAAEESWPPSTPVLSNWRNSASDCLDVLHWCANGKAAHAAGWEHPTILHLHLARLILLTPVRHIQTLADAPSAATWAGGGDSNECARARSHVLQWAIRDQFKARLSLVHAGALFWHVRRFSVNSFPEPFAIYIATLVVWAYSVTAQFVSSQDEASRVPRVLDVAARSSVDGDPLQDVSRDAAQEVPGASLPEDTEPCPEPSFVNLDRPLDDELVQTYVRLGYKMTASLLRVGNICDADAPVKILFEGIRLLVGESGVAGQATQGSADVAHEKEPACGSDEEAPETWGIERSYVKSLRSLAEATARQRH